MAAARWEVDPADVRFVVRGGAGGVERTDRGRSGGGWPTSGRVRKIRRQVASNVRVPKNQRRRARRRAASRFPQTPWPPELKPLCPRDREGSGAPRLGIAELAQLAHTPLQPFPAHLEPGLEVHAAYDPPGVPVSCAAHVALVEVDRLTGAARVIRYVVSEDCGPIVNLAAVDGQIRGAVAQGIGCALLESIEYDEGGQHRSASLMDYLVPTMGDVPDIDIVHMETPSPFTESGIKGMGESGIIGAPAAVVNAVLDALGAEPAELVLPLTPERIVALAASASAPVSTTPTATS